jgi:hypothetical protein
MLQVLKLQSPAVISSTEAALYIKGFASVASIDREGDYVDPLEFNWKKFMTSPTLLVNHKYWIDDRGNQVPAGRVTKAIPSELAVDPQSELNWLVKSLLDSSDITTFPKEAVPDLGVGAKGLFVIAEVQQEEVADMVRQGKLSAFSWVGAVDARKSGNKRLLTNIDLVEVSLVHIPMNPDATFVIGKSADWDSLSVYGIRLDKTRFETCDQAKAYLEDHSYISQGIQDAGTHYMCLQNSEIDLDSLVRVNTVNGVCFVAGKSKEVSGEAKLEETNSGIEKSRPTVRVEGMSRKSLTISGSDVTVTIQDKEEVVKDTAEKGSLQTSTEVPKQQFGKRLPVTPGLKHETGLKNETGLIKEKGMSLSEQQQKSLVEAVAKGVADSLSGHLVKLTEAVTLLATKSVAVEATAEVVQEDTVDSSEDSLDESEAEDTAEDTAEVPEEGDAKFDVLAGAIIQLGQQLEQIAQATKSMREESANVQEKLKTLTRSASTPVRSERAPAKKGKVEDDNPFSIFDSIPIFSSR